MNKYQEALDYLVGELKGCDEAISDEEFRKELSEKREAAEKLLQELVDKTKPRKLLKNGLCGSCDARVIVSFQGYCAQCGQALDWREDECCN